MPKIGLRVETYGAIDETSLDLALAVAHDGLPEWMVEMLALIRNELFDVDVGLSTPLHPSPQYPPLRVEQPFIDRLEGWCNELGAEPPSLCLFVLPDGSPVVAQLYAACVARRRAERVAWRAVQVHDTGPSTERGEGGVSLLAVAYLDRLNGLLFNMYRITVGPEGDVL